ncbi:MAG: NYN domain-containing protein [Patescibacteria group bacterium]
MINKFNNHAYIDGANLHKGITGLGWKMNYKRFRVWLREKYSVTTAYIFIGLIPKHKDIYTNLQEAGFTLIFKEVVYDSDGKAKGNCDADLVLKVTQDAYENIFDQAIIVSSDGDYAGMIKFLLGKSKLKIILSPAQVKKCSILLKRTNAPISYIHDQKSILQLKEKTPDKDDTL